MSFLFEDPLQRLAADELPHGAFVCFTSSDTRFHVRSQNCGLWALRYTFAISKIEDGLGSRLVLRRQSGGALQPHPLLAGFHDAGSDVPRHRTFHSTPVKAELVLYVRISSCAGTLADPGRRTVTSSRRGDAFS